MWDNSRKYWNNIEEIPKEVGLGVAVIKDRRTNYGHLDISISRWGSLVQRIGSCSTAHKNKRSWGKSMMTWTQGVLIDMKALFPGWPRRRIHMSDWGEYNLLLVGYCTHLELRLCNCWQKGSIVPYYFGTRTEYLAVIHFLFVNFLLVEYSFCFKIIFTCLYIADMLNAQFVTLFVLWERAVFNVDALVNWF